MKNTVLIILILISIDVHSQTDTSAVKFVNPSSLSRPTGYSHSVEVDLGKYKMVFISGQVALNNEGKVIGKDDLKKQAEQVFQNIKAIVENAGGTMDNIVKTGIFMVDVSQVPALREVRNKFINTQNPPASTLVQVSKLFRDDLLIEIEATAIIPKK